MDEEKSQLTDVLSSIRSLSGVTVVRNDEIEGNNDRRNFKSALNIKVDPYPYIKQHVALNTITSIIIGAIKKIPGVKGFFANTNKKE